MRTGERRVGARLVLTGYSYLALLIFLAVTAAGLAALGQRAALAMQHERERELEFRGKEIARAIASYMAATPAEQMPKFPRSMQDLLLDGRQLVPRHHLRRVYRDPYTGAADWVLIAAPVGNLGFMGVRSASGALLPGIARHGKQSANQWIFTASDGESPASGLAPIAVKQVPPMDS